MRKNNARRLLWSVPIGALLLTVPSAVPQEEAPALAIAEPCSFDPPDHFDTWTRDEEDFDTEEFVETVVAAIGQERMGYAVVLQNADGERIAWVKYGYARTPCETQGERRFGIRTKAALGSVSKVITSVAAMHRIESYQGPPPAPIPSLVGKMKSYLPDRWRSILHSSFQPVSVKDLMQHKAGFKKTAPGEIWERLDGGVETENGVGVRKYSNTSATMFSVMPYFFDPEAATLVDDSLEGESTEDYNPAVRDASMRGYQEYVQAHLLEPLGLRAQCNDAVFPDGNWAMFYRSDSDEEGKLVTDPDTPQCAAGGWMMSTLALAKLAYVVSRTEQILSSGAWSQMANVEDPDDRMGLQRYELSDGTGFGHNGARWNGKAKAQVTFFPNGFTAAVLGNSKPAEDAQGFGPALEEAYEAALD